MHTPEPRTPFSVKQLWRYLLPVAGLATAWFAISHFANTAWPFERANTLLVVAAGVVVALSYLCRAIAWQRLFHSTERPCRGALLAASGAASVSGTVLPGRLDWAVKFVVLRRLRRTPVKVDTIALSLGSLALLDAVAICPLAVATLIACTSTPLRAASAIVVAGGAAAALVFLASGRLLRQRRLQRWPRVAAKLEEAAARTTNHKDGILAAGALSLCWVCRVAGGLLLLAALDVSYSPLVALLFVVLSAAAVVINVIPIGPAVQMGAGTAVLTTLHVDAVKAAEFTLASNLLFVFAATAGSLVGFAWYARHGAARRMRRLVT